MLFHNFFPNLINLIFDKHKGKPISNINLSI